MLTIGVLHHLLRNFTKVGITGLVLVPILFSAGCKPTVAHRTAQSTTDTVPAAVALLAAPANPTGLAATVNSTSQITLDWTAAAAPASDYVISYQSGATAPATCALGTTISAASVTGVSHPVSSLAAGSQYSFRVCSINANPSPDVSSGVTVTATTLFSAPGNPSGLAATVNSTSQITLDWTAAAAPASDYVISYQTGATAPATCALGTTISSASVTGVSHPVASLAAGTQYSFRVCSINANPSPDVSSGVTVTATTLLTAPVNPTGLAATVNSTTQITLDWTAAAAPASDYVISYQTGATAPATCALGTTISAASVTGVSHPVSSLAAGTQYSFRVCSINANPSPDVSSGVTVTATTNGAIAPFVSVWRTSAPTQTITLPLRSGYTYNFNVDWGDGTANSSVTAWNDTDKVHTYTVAGDYTVTISGTAQAWYFHNTGDKLKIIQVIDLGNVGWTNLNGAFHGCANLTSLAGGETSAVTDMSSMFNGASSVTSLDLSTFNTVNITNMSAMFSNMTMMTSLDLSNFDTSNVTNMGFMFTDMIFLTNLDISSFDTTKVTNLNGMFINARSLTSLNLSNFNTANTLSMNFMFYNMDSLTSLNISSFNTAKVIDMSYMFYGVELLTSLNLSNFNTALVTNMSWMFYGMTHLTSLNISTFNTANVTDMNYMFASLNLLTSLDVSNFNTAKVIDMNNMFAACNALTSLDLSSFNTALVTDMNQMFLGDSSLTSLNVSSFNTAAVTNMATMFANCTVLTTLNLSSFTTAAVTDMNQMFYNMASLTSLNVSSFNTALVTDMNYMFAYLSSLTSLNLSNFNTAAVTNMDNIFRNTTNLLTLNTTGWNITAASASTNVFTSSNAGIVVTCDQGGSPATGTFFAKACN